jgi:hypothetical protein
LAEQLANANAYGKKYGITMEVAEAASIEALSVGVAAELRVSRDSVVRWFGDLAGVLDLGTPELVRRHKRRKRCLRIPRSVLTKFLQERMM